MFSTDGSYYFCLMKKQMLIQREEKSIGSEQKIIAAAFQVFQSKGYAATRTRDIAEAAGINLALLNYYFRSKEKLFEIILLQSMADFMGIMTTVINDEQTTLEKKVENIIDAYHKMLHEKPSIPLFILSELRQGNHAVLLKASGLKKIYQKSHFAKQYQVGVDKGKYASRPMLWLIMNMMSLTIFPFMAEPLLRVVGDLDNKEYQLFLSTRKDFIVKWVLQTLKS